MMLEKHKNLKKMTAYAAACLCFVLFAVFLSGSGQASQSAPLPEKIEIYFFHDTACGSCNGTSEFYSTFSEKLGENKKLYPYRINTVNVFKSWGRERMEQMLASISLSREDISLPLMIINGKAFSGTESIEKNMLEAFLTAGEDIFVYESVYTPSEKPAALFTDMKARPRNNTIVYFYRTVCDECNQTKPVIDSLPALVTVNNKETAVDIVRLNTRSGNNSDKIRAFFEAYNVPEKDQMVPIVFFTDTYLAGYDAIEALINGKLEQGAGMNFKYPDTDE